MGESKKLIYEFDYMYRNEICTNVKVFDIDGREVVEIKDFKENDFYKAFGNWSHSVTVDDVEKFLESRCVPRNRQNVKNLIDASGSTVGFNARFFINVTHGTMADDEFWIRFTNERNLTWQDVRVWNNVTIE